MTKPKLLLADDSATIRKVVELTFVDEGIEVFAVADGDATMLKFVEVQPDIVLVDVEMPGPNGYQICEMIKQDDATRHIPVLLLVGSFEPFDQTEAERVGADGFLTKPFHSIRELVALVWDLLGMGDPPLAVGPETEDIEDLYGSSFAETIPIQEYDTEEHLFREAGLDNETIEAPPTEAVDNTRMEDPFGDAGLDDEMIETVHPGGPADQNGQPEAIPVVETPEPALVKDFDWSPAAKVVDEAKLESEETGFEPPVSFSESDSMLETTAAANTEHSFSHTDETVAEPSDELVALIAKRVVEKLSDHLIREIAQEAVPRIAEKLIREALDEENKQ